MDAVADETDTNNNCSTSVPVTVPQPARPDLMVTSPAASDHGPATGGPFTLSASVRNGGNGDASATTLRYYRSADAAITTSDTQVGTSAVAELAASGSASQLVDLTAPATPGTYYYGACVDAVTDESDTTNNCSGSVKVAILQPDLVVGAPSVSTRYPEAGERFTLWVTVENNGEGEGEWDTATLRYYYSTDTAITTSDTEVDTVTVVNFFNSLFIIGESVVLTAPSTPGTYYYGACVDAVTDESDTTNNCSASVQVTVPQPKPDLVVGSPSVDHSGPGGRGAICAVRDGGEPWRGIRVHDDPALLPVGVRDDLNVGHEGWRGCNRRARGFRYQQPIRGSDGARARNVLLRRMRGRGDGRVGHDEQLLDFGGGDGTGGGTATRVQNRNIAGFAELRHAGRDPDSDGNGLRPEQLRHAAHLHLHLLVLVFSRRGSGEDEPLWFALCFATTDIRAVDRGGNHHRHAERGRERRGGHGLGDGDLAHGTSDGLAGLADLRQHWATPRR